MFSFSLTRRRATGILRSLHRHRMAASQGPVEASIRQKLANLLEPTALEVENDSWKHKHHRAMLDQGGGGGETHFSIYVISNAFKGKTLMQRHRMIYGALADELQHGLHALSLVTKTPEELPASPQ